MRTRSVSAWPLIVSLAIGCGSVSTLGGHGGSGGQGTGGTGTGGTATGGAGTGGAGTGGSGGGASGGNTGRGGASGGSTGHGGSGGGGSAGHGGAGGGSAGHGGTGGGSAGHGGTGGGGTGRGGAGGANGGPCWNAGDCGAATCTPPGTPVCGGACIGVQHPCTSDAECQGDAAIPSICAQVPCSCPSGMGCVPGCTSNADCPEGQSCASNHHCGATTCTVGADTCPANFTCGASTLAGGGVCVRKSCTVDAECSSACVEGYCYPAAGTCRLPLP